jgi:putative glycosyltransferase (TIGR04348 family)
LRVRIPIVCPAPPGSRLGNRVTALRWARMLRELGHDAWVGEPAGDWHLLIALHARKSAEAVRRAREEWPARPIAVALTGTDLYRDIHRDAAARRTLKLADLLVVLHSEGALALPEALRSKARVVLQSAESLAPAPRAVRSFEVAVVGHLRREKDPLRAALAARLAPASSRLRILQAGRALTPAFARAAEREMRRNPRYHWLGELPHGRARRLIARAQLLLLTSSLEGGANVLAEALASGTPILSSRIAAAESLLGADYPGFYPVGDTRALAEILNRAEFDTRFYSRLASHCRSRAPLVRPAREKAALGRLLRELA